MNDLEQAALDRLMAREARQGPVTHRQAWLAACVRGLKTERVNQARPDAGRGQAAIIERHERERQPLPPPADMAAKVRAEPYLAAMRACLLGDV